MVYPRLCISLAHAWTLYTTASLLAENLSQIRLIHQNGYISSPTQKHSRKYVNTQLEILKDAVYLFLHEHLLM